MQAITEFKLVKKNVQNTKKGNEINNLGILLKKPSPKKFAEEREKTFSAYGSNARAIIDAKIKVESARRALDVYVRLEKEAEREMDAHNEKLKKALIKFSAMSQRADSLEEILVVCIFLFNVLLIFQ